MEKRNDIIRGPKIYNKVKKLFHKDDFSVEIQSDVMNSAQVKRIVDVTSTFSGREIAKLMIAIQGAAYASENGVLTSKMVDHTVKMKVSDHKEKLKMSGNTKIPQSPNVGNVQL